MDTIVFKKSRINMLYITEHDDASGWRGFRSRGTIAGDPDLLSVTKTWKEHGVYFFAPYQPNSLDQFSNVLAAYIQRINPASDEWLLLWLQDPNADAFYDDSDTGRQVNTWKLHVKEFPNGNMLLNDFNCILGNYVSFIVPSKSEVFYDESLSFIRLKAFQTRAIYFANMDGSSRPDVKDDTVYIPFLGPDIGSFRFQFSVLEHDFYDDFGVSLRYFHNTQGTQDAEVLCYPLFHNDERNSSLTFEAAIDPVSVWNKWFLQKPWRTYLAFDESNQALDSYYRTQFGREVQLMPFVKLGSGTADLPYRYPEEDSALLVFSPQNKETISDNESMYLVPKGAFQIIIPELVTESSMLTQLLCGLTGTETITCVPKSIGYDGDVLYFYPLMPAYAPEYPHEDGATWRQTSQLLTDRYVTSWMTVKRLSHQVDLEHLSIQYLTQSEDGALFQPKEGLEQISSLFQPPFLDMTNPTRNIYVPLVPISGVDLSTLAPAVLFEQSIVVRFRKAIMDKQAQSSFGTPIAASTGESLTPQGLILKEVGGEWAELLLARNNLEGQAQPVSLQINKISPKLKSALLTPQLFLVISNADELPDFQNHIPIAGWPFHINLPPSTSAEYRNVLIFKFCEGTLFERIADPKLWTNPEFFNRQDELKELSSWMIEHCTTNMDVSNKNAAKFRNILNDPTWNGIIALKVDVPVAQLPRDLKGLLGDINTSDFFAHHIGLQINRVTQQGGKLEMSEVSSMFAYIHYADPTCDAAPLDEGHEFKVCKLEALFDNSKITAFNALLQLKISHLFGNKVSNINNVMRFEGKYDEIEEVPTYSFYSINPVDLFVNNTFLNYVQLTKATFATVQETAEQIETRFSFWGNLQFHLNDAFADVFSYGGKDSSLFFSNLGIRMSLPTSLDQKAAKPIYAFDATQVSIDIGSSKRRDKSFAAGFPLQLSSFRSDFDPDSLKASGYKEITIKQQNIPCPKIVEEPEKWYGLEFNLDLGSLGHLSTDNSLQSELIICWSSHCRSYLGLRISGLGLERFMLSLEQALETSIDGLRIEEEEGVFRLILEQFTQQFLGKQMKPSAGKDQIVVFADPTGPSSTSNLGWYAAFKNNNSI